MQGIDRRTQQIEPNHNFGQSVAAGVKSLMNGKGRTYYVLKHMTQSANFPLGKEEEIIIDYIELGRDPKCQVRFDEKMATVSRRHAAIARDNTGWVIRNLSRSNPTLINGRPVNVQWFLNSGDEIQLSMEGPRVRFIVPQNNSVASIPLSRRLSLFRQQSLRPYRQAIIALSALLVLSIGGFSWWGWQMKVRGDQLAENWSVAMKDAKEVRTKLDSVNLRVGDTEKINTSLRNQLNRLNRTIRRGQNIFAGPNNTGTAPPQAVEQNSPDMTLLEAQHPSVYFLRMEKIVIEYETETKEVNDLTINGTGFLLNDGRFVTARHMVRPWEYINEGSPEPILILLNMIINNKVGKVSAIFKAYSSTNSFTLNSNDFKTDDSQDRTLSIVDPESGTNVVVKLASLDDGSDWAMARPGRTGVIESGADVADNLPAGTKLFTLGYPFGLGAESPSNIKPFFGHSEVSGQSLGMIMVTDRNFDSGNSGGPAFYNKNGRMVAVGIISSIRGSMGGIVPINHVR